ncbi:hypothetical protein TYRP_015111, partial [Tyrophagus putrescentiae]
LFSFFSSSSSSSHSDLLSQHQKTLSSLKQHFTVRLLKLKLLSSCSSKESKTAAARYQAEADRLEIRQKTLDLGSLRARQQQGQLINVQKVSERYGKLTTKWKRLLERTEAKERELAARERMNRALKEVEKRRAQVEKEGSKEGGGGGGRGRGDGQGLKKTLKKLEKAERALENATQEWQELAARFEKQLDDNRRSYLARGVGAAVGLAGLLSFIYWLKIADKVVNGVHMSSKEASVVNKTEDDGGGGDEESKAVLLLISLLIGAVLVVIVARWLHARYFGGKGTAQKGGDSLEESENTDELVERLQTALMQNDERFPPSKLGSKLTSGVRRGSFALGGVLFHFGPNASIEREDKISPPPPPSRSSTSSSSSSSEAPLYAYVVADPMVHEHGDAQVDGAFHRSPLLPLFFWIAFAGLCLLVLLSYGSLARLEEKRRRTSSSPSSPSVNSSWWHNFITTIIITTTSRQPSFQCLLIFTF